MSVRAVRLLLGLVCFLGAAHAWAQAARKTVLVVGGGYGGLEAATQLAQEGSTRVVLVDRESHNARITHLPGYVAFDEPIETPFTDLARQSGFEFNQGEITRWDAGKKEVELADGRRLGYDAIIVAVGAQAATPAALPGVKEHAFGFRTLREARALKQALRTRLGDARGRGKPLDVVIIGAGPSGIELSGALARSLRGAARVHLVQRGPYLKPFGDSTTPTEGEAAAAWLRDLGVHVRTGAAPTKVDATGVELAHQRLDADLVVATMGDVGAGASLGHAVDGQSRVAVDAFLKHRAGDHAYVIGDAAAITDAAGQSVAQAAKKAKAQGALAAQNALRGLRGQALVPYHDEPKPVVPGRIQSFLAKHVGK